MQKIIDLTLEITNKMLVQDAFQSNIYVTTTPSLLPGIILAWWNIQEPMWMPSSI